jgi:hypothetical protein
LVEPNRPPAFADLLYLLRNSEILEWGGAPYQLLAFETACAVLGREMKQAWVVNYNPI